MVGIIWALQEAIGIDTGTGLTIHAATPQMLGPWAKWLGNEGKRKILETDGGEKDKVDAIPFSLFAKSKLNKGGTVHLIVFTIFGLILTLFSLYSYLMINRLPLNWDTLIMGMFIIITYLFGLIPYISMKRNEKKVKEENREDYNRSLVVKKVQKEILKSGAELNTPIHGVQTVERNVAGGWKLHNSNSQFDQVSWGKVEGDIEGTFSVLGGRFSGNVNADFRSKTTPKLHDEGIFFKLRKGDQVIRIISPSVGVIETVVGEYVSNLADKYPEGSHTNIAIKSMADGFDPITDILDQLNPSYIQDTLELISKSDADGVGFVGVEAFLSRKKNILWGFNILLKNQEDGLVKQPLFPVNTLQSIFEKLEPLFPEGSEYPNLAAPFEQFLPEGKKGNIRRGDEFDGGITEKIGFIYKADVSERREQVRTLLKEIKSRNTSCIPEMILVSDYHGGAERLSSLLSSIFERLSEFKGEFDLKMPIIEQLKAQGILIENIKGALYFNGDLLDRGKLGLRCFMIVRELVESVPEKILYISGNHDLWAFLNLLALHLPFYKGFHFYGDKEAEELVKKHRESEPENVNDKYWWAERLAEFNEYQKKFEDEFFGNKDNQKEVRSKFLAYQKGFQDEWNEKQKFTWEKFTGNFAAIKVPDAYVGI
ncbi:MAG: metallophosphoesterase, partial [Candidatus Omnitrophica bacterium]|nr:metallophosphoesterase [Candidatus Omnitrophota bacterium]